MFIYLSRRVALGLLTAVGFAGTTAIADQAARGQIALTFDDAPTGQGTILSGTQRTQMLIEGLSKGGVSGAMFFVLTGNIGDTSDAARLRAYTDAGHVLANHSHSHPWLRESEPATYLQDIDRAADILSEYESVAAFFRFPYLDEGNTPDRRLDVQDGLRARGLQNGYVTVDTYDWYMQSMLNDSMSAGHDVDMDILGTVYVDVLMQGIEFYDDIAQAQLGRSPRHVVLLHENDLAALFVPQLIAALRADGWDIIPAQDAFDDPISQITPATEFNGQGRIAAIAYTQGIPPRDLVSPMEEEHLLQQIFRENGLLPERTIYE